MRMITMSCTVLAAIAHAHATVSSRRFWQASGALSCWRQDRTARASLGCFCQWDASSSSSSWSSWGGVLCGVVGAGGSHVSVGLRRRAVCFVSWRGADPVRGSCRYCHLMFRSSNAVPFPSFADDAFGGGAAQEHLQRERGPVWLVLFTAPISTTFPYS